MCTAFILNGKLSKLLNVINKRYAVRSENEGIIPAIPGDYLIARVR